MKIAISVHQNQVSEHFGYCEKFLLVSVQDHQILSQEYIANPGHKRGYLPPYLNELGVECLIVGGIGASAVHLFKLYGIEVIMGVVGTVNEVVENIIHNQLNSTGDICHEHIHSDDCANEEEI